jgi:hypothetical protein
MGAATCAYRKIRQSRIHAGAGAKENSDTSSEGSAGFVARLAVPRTSKWVSRPEELHLQPLIERSVNLSIHSCPPQKLSLRVSLRLLAGQSGAPLHCSNRVFVMQATKDRFCEDERIRRQAMAGF